MSRLPRPRVELEERLVSEWCARAHPKARILRRARLGPLPPNAYALEAQGLNPMLYTVTRHWADALIFYPDRSLLVEGKLKLSPAALGQLLIYWDNFYETPEYRDQWKNPLELIALYAYASPAMLRSYQGRGITCHRYCPPWAQEAYVKRVKRDYRGR